MRILTLTSLYPNNQQPLNGIFNKERVRCLSELCEVKVVAPVPYFPSIRVNEKWYAFSQVAKKEIVEGVEIFHPRRFVTPKIGMVFYGIFYFLSVVRQILAIQKEFNFDLIDAHFAYPDGFAAVLLSKLLRKPVVITVHGIDINLYPKYPLIKRQIIYTLKNTDRIIAVCQALKDRIIKLGIPENKIKVIPNAVDLKKFKPIDKIQARKEVNLPLNKKIILSVGHLIERKGFHYLIDAISEIKNNGEINEDPFFVIVGEGIYRSKLENQIKKLDIEKQVRLVGAKPHDELYKWYSASDLFALASSSEGWPTVFFEAFACGKPAVATKAGGTAEVISSKHYGILADRQNGKELADKIIEALHKDWDIQKLVNYARQNTWDRIMEKVFCEFEAAIG